MIPEILVTRPAGQAPDLCAALHARGIRAVAVPTVAIDSASAASEVDALLTGSLRRADWLVVTSANGAAALVERIRATAWEMPAHLKVAAVGPATARALEAGGIRPAYVPDEYRTVAIAEGLGDVAGRRVVLARADAATPALREVLATRGAEVLDVVAYRTVEGPPTNRDALRVALHRDLSGIAFTSSSTVRGLLALTSPVDRQRAGAIPAFCIGPVTAETARRFGFEVEVVADAYTADGLAEGIARHVQEGDR
jgi:uroporphyrinogen III methyltransferase/synthase